MTLAFTLKKILTGKKKSISEQGWLYQRPHRGDDRGLHITRPRAFSLLLTFSFLSQPFHAMATPGAVATLLRGQGELLHNQ